MTNSIKATIAAAFLAFAAATPSLAADEHNVSTGITTSGAPLGLHGVDAVALSTSNTVVEGDAVHTIVEDGVAYYFATAESARRFKAAPENYMPKYGGFCAFAVALGKKFDGDPRFADIVDGKLYLFVNAEIFAKYKKNPEKILANAEKKWPTIKHKAVKDL